MLGDTVARKPQQVAQGPRSSWSTGGGRGIMPTELLPAMQEHGRKLEMIHAVGQCSEGPTLVVIQDKLPDGTVFNRRTVRTCRYGNLVGCCPHYSEQGRRCDLLTEDEKVLAFEASFNEWIEDGCDLKLYERTREDDNDSDD